MDSLYPLLYILLLIVSFVGGLFTKSYLPDYFGQKGKNLATKEDIEEITQRTEKARQLQQRKEKKIDKVNEQLNRFLELTELYAFFANREGHIVKDESGELLKDEAGNYVIEEHILEAEPRFEKAIEALRGSDLKSAIAQKIAEIRLSSGEAITISIELDPNGELRKKFQELYIHAKFVEDWIERKDFEQMVNSLQEARQTGREIYSMLEGYRNNGQ